MVGPCPEAKQDKKNNFVKENAALDMVFRVN
jgi:hypothetical protein